MDERAERNQIDVVHNICDRFLNQIPSTCKLVGRAWNQGGFMLFSGLACFSPSVPAALRRLWVKNGGRLTHTDADFCNAEFFFCDGMKDPWLQQLRSRSLIVRHAAWVALCARERFVMPVADYTLDDRFDESSIIVHQHTSTGDVQLAKPKSNQVMGKRPHDDEDIYQSHLQRPNKRARIEDEELVIIDLQVEPTGGQNEKIITFDETTEKKVVKSVEHLVLGDDSKKVGIPQVSKPKSVLQRIKKFESLIQPKRCSPPSSNIWEKTRKGVTKSVVDPHTLFWNNLCFKTLTRNQNCIKKLTLKIDDFNDAPGVNAGIFTVNENFLGKKFINMDYEFD